MVFRNKNYIFATISGLILFPKEKDMKKRSLYIASTILGLFLLIGSIRWGYKQLYLQEQHAEIDLYTLVPTDCIAMLETNDINALYKSINYAEFYNDYQDFHVSDILDFLTKDLDKLTHQQAHGLSAEMSQLLVSFHTPDTSQDQIVYGRFGSNDKGFIKSILKNYKPNQYPPKKNIYRGEEITIYPVGNGFLACYIQQSYFVISLQKKLIEKVIDTIKDGNSINENESFKIIRHQRKHNEPATLYLRSTHTPSRWEEFNIRMNSEAIFLTGGEEIADTCQFFGTPIIQHKAINIIDETELPGNIQMLYQCPLIYKNLITETTEKTLQNYLQYYGSNEVSGIMFTHNISKEPLQLLMFRVPPPDATKMQQEFRLDKNAKRKATIWVDGKAFPQWQYEANDKLYDYLFIKPSTPIYTITYFGDYMLLAENTETLRSYLEEIATTQKKTDRYINKSLYRYCLNDLSEQANYTMITDMNEIVGNDSIFQLLNKNIIPTFFYKHKEFFRNFMLATQLIYNDGLISTNIIFTYQGDSARIRQ